jgi:hypothetical protein
VGRVMHGFLGECDADLSDPIVPHTSTSSLPYAAEEVSNKISIPAPT